jgi:polyphosphate kinase 2 (PPK2 family)
VAKNGSGKKAKLKNKDYTKELRRLQAELCNLQEWVKHKGLRIIVVFEGRDGAGKGGTIRALTERVSPRVFRVAALPAPTDREKSQTYMQRYMAHFPAAGEVVIFDRSLAQPGRRGEGHGLRHGRSSTGDSSSSARPSRSIVDGGILLLEVLAEVGRARSTSRRFEARITDPAAVEALSRGPPGPDQVVRVPPAPATRCWQPPTPATRHGTSCARTTRRGRG